MNIPVSPGDVIPYAIASGGNASHGTAPAGGTTTFGNFVTMTGGNGGTSNNPGGTAPVESLSGNPGNFTPGSFSGFDFTNTLRTYQFMPGNQGRGGNPGPENSSPPPTPGTPGCLIIFENDGT
jgi:hypothetical protein